MQRRDFLYEKANIWTFLKFQSLGLDKELSLDQTANFIHQEVDGEFVKSILRNNAFLYRGRDTEDAHIGRDNENGIYIMKPKPDLLSKDTYGDEEAVVYFECLESSLIAKKSVTRPSTGHIATADVLEASLWGTAVSVWPLTRPINFLWIGNRKLFWPIPDKAISNCNVDDVHINEGLDISLREKHEVMFTGSFLEVPAKYDKDLREKLVSLIKI